MESSAKKRLFCYFLALLPVGFIFAQDAASSDEIELYIHKEVQKELDSLKANGVETVVCYFSYLYGLRIMDSTGDYYHFQYMLWKSKSKTFIQKFVYNNDSLLQRQPPILTINENVFKFLNENYSDVRSGMILPFIYKSVNDSIECYRVLSSPHQHYVAIRVYSKGDEFLKTIYDTNMREDLSGTPPVNLNYHYNQATAVKRFVDLIEQLIVKTTGAITF